MQTISHVLKKYSSLIMLILIAVIAGVPHGYNMFHFPYYENDEGVYMSQAWSLLQQGKLAPYTYWYDHAPAGWIFMALWNVLSGGFYTFGFSINSGRVFILILHILSSISLYYIALKLTGSRLAGLLSVVLFSFSPLAIYFQRRVLLDNIMTFWLLSSLVCILYYRGKLRSIIVSALMFGIAILSKENAIFFIPIFIYIIYVETDKEHTSFALATWISIFLSVTALYFLYASVKGELFPSGTVFGGTQEHVSLFATMQQHLNRGGGGVFNISKSTFWNKMELWLKDDPVIILLGLISSAVNVFIGVKSKAAQIAGLLSASFWVFLLRGGVVFDFYIIPIFPFLALSIAVSTWHFGKKLRTTFQKEIYYPLPSLMTLIFFSLSSFYFSTNIRNNLNVFTSDQTTPQIQAVHWMLSRKEPEAIFVIDNYGYIELHENTADKFKYAEWYWKIDRDPTIRRKVLKGGATAIDYIALTPQMSYDIYDPSIGGLTSVRTAWSNSQPIARFWKDGWGVEMRATKFDNRIIRESWRSYKNKFIQDGRVVDTGNIQSTTSIAQADTLIRSVWMKDESTFDSVWDFTQKNFQQPNGLFIWNFDINKPQQQANIKEGTTSGADQEIALALLFAYKTWHRTEYLQNARTVLNGIWKHEVALIGTMPYMTAANWANHQNTLTINPSYLSPASYRIFAEADPTHAWIRLVDSTYWILQHCTDEKLDKSTGKLPPEWCSIHKQTLAVSQPSNTQPHDTEYGFNAVRIPWNVALDYIWYNEPRAKHFLASLHILSDEYNKRNKLAAAYQHDGKVLKNYESVTPYASDMGYFFVVDPAAADQLYKDKILGRYYEDENRSYWEDPENYHTQNWSWFGTALYTNHLQNLWNL